MSIIKGIKAGSTNITSTYTDGESRSDTKELVVSPVSLANGTISKPANTVYTGSAIEVKPVITVSFDGDVVTLVEGEDYSLSYSSNINAGTARVTATGIGNYTGSLSETWTITAADFTVIANDQSYTYDGGNHGMGITVTGVGDVTPVVRYGFEPGTYNIVSFPQIRNVVDSKTVYFKVSDSNYNDYYGSYELAVGPRLAELEWGQLFWIYDGNEHQTTCVVTNLVPGDTCNVALFGNSITNVGETTVTARATESLDNPNYMLSQNESRVLTISPGLFVKLANNWIPVKKVFKMISGSWVQQEFDNAFSVSEKYVKVD